MRITHATPKAIRYACMKFHYAKSIPVNTIGYNVYNDNGDWCGVVLYGTGATISIGKPYGLNQGQILELVRVALNGKQECTSKAVALTLKQIKRDCPLCRLVISYADIDQNHLGTIYQATNWIYTGRMNENSKDGWIVNGKRVHNRTVSSMVKSKGGTNGLSRDEFIKKYYDENAQVHVTAGKHKYLMPMDKAMRKQIEPLRLPYPKTDPEWHKIDRRQFQEQKQT